MKTLQAIVSLSVAGLLVVLVLHFIGSRSVDFRLTRQDTRIEEISKDTAKHGEDIAAQKKQLTAVDGKVASQAKRLEVLEKRVTQTEEGIRKKTAEIQALRTDATKDRESIRRLEDDLLNLKKDYEKSISDLRTFRDEVQERDELTDRRLREIEAKVGIKPPAP